MRELLSITECPYVLPDGSISTPGFDRSTGTLCRPSVKIPALPGRLSQQDARDAAERLFRVVYQFPFETGFDWSVWLANLLTCIQRPVISGPTPGFAYNGNAAGVGKGLLIDLLGILVWGHPVGTRAYPVDPKEAEKVKLSLAIAAVPIVHFDNLTEGGSYGGGVIDSALTSMFAEGRILGETRESGLVPLRPVWTLSGNNVSPIKDAGRRWLPCNLVTSLDRPHERTDFQATNLREYALQNRGAILRDAMVVLKAHAIAGRPTEKDKDSGRPVAPLGSYEEWDPIVRGAVWYATGNDCLHTQRKGEADRPDRNQKAALLQGWLEADPDRKGMTIEEAIEKSRENPALYPVLHAALMELSLNNKLPSVDRVQYKVRAMKKTPINRIRFDSCEENRNHQKLWKVVAC